MEKQVNLFIDTTKVPEQSLQLWADIITISAKNNQTIEQTIRKMKSKLSK